jgi:hypothetical protein
MRGLVLAHVLAVGVWFGVVAVEIVLERSRAASQPISRAVARYHFRIDLLLEIPTVLVVLGTGLAMLDPARLSGWYLAKVACGLVAVASNAVCVVPVVLRVRAAERARPDDVVRYSRMIDWTAVVGIPAAVVAFSIAASGIA